MRFPTLTLAVAALMAGVSALPAPLNAAVEDLRAELIKDTKQTDAWVTCAGETHTYCFIFSNLACCSQICDATNDVLSDRCVAAPLK